MVKLTKTERIENVVTKLKTRRSKFVLYTILLVIGWSVFAYRFYEITVENNFEVFNIVHNKKKNGVPVYVLNMQKTDGVLYEPLTIKNNRAYVSGARIDAFKSGQKVGDCKIVSVSSNIDMDTGMHVIKTSGCKDGLQYAQIQKNGFYVPASAMRGDNLFVVNNGTAEVRTVVVERRDAQNVLIKSGLNDGDVVILSNVQNGQKVKVEE